MWFAFHLNIPFQVRVPSVWVYYVNTDNMRKWSMTYLHVIVIHPNVKMKLN